MNPSNTAEEQIRFAIIQTGSETLNMANGAWIYLFNKLAFEAESPEKDFAIKHGYVAAFLKEIHRDPIRPHPLRIAVETTTWMTFNKKYVQDFVRTPDFLVALREGSERWIPGHTGRGCFTCFKNLAYQEDAKEHCFKAGGLELALSNLAYLDEDESFKVLAVNAVQLICRLVRKDDDACPVQEVIRKNPKIIETLLWILTRILDAGEGGAVLGDTWNPAGTVTDVATLSCLEQTRTLLGPFVPQLARLLSLRTKELVAVKRAIFVLVQLTSEPRCQVYFDHSKQSLISGLRLVLNANEKENETDPNWQGTEEFIKHLLSFLADEPSRKRQRS